MNKNILLFSFIVLTSLCSIGQNEIWSHLRFDINLNYLNKKRSYAVYSNDKYTNSGYFFGLDFGLHYELEKIDLGLEYYPYNHINGTIAYNGLNILRGKIKPNLKLGYTPTLDKFYYGAGIKISYAWFHISYNKILHLKSGESQYHGDGLNVFSAGISLKINKKD